MKLFVFILLLFQALQASADAQINCWVNGLKSPQYKSDFPTLKYDQVIPGYAYIYKTDELRVTIVAHPFPNQGKFYPAAPLTIVISDANGENSIFKEGSVWPSADRQWITLEDRKHNIQVSCIFDQYIMSRYLSGS